MVSEEEAWSVVPKRTWLHDFMSAVEARTDAPVAFSLGAGLALASMLVPSEACVQQGLHGHQFVCLVGPTGSRKTEAVKHAERLMLQLSPDELLSAPESEAGLVESLEETPQSLLLYPEFGRFLMATKAGSYKESLRAVYTSVWDGNRLTKKKVSRDNDSNELVIDNPRLSILAAGAPSFFEQALTSHDLAGGFLPRILFLYANRERSFPVTPILPHPSDMWDAYGRLQAKAAMEWGECVGWEEEAEDFWADWMDDLRAKHKDNIRLEGFISRADTIGLKAILALSILLGVSINDKKPWKINLEMAEYASRLIKLHMESVDKLLSGLTQGRYARVRRIALDLVETKGKVTLQSLLRTLAVLSEPRPSRECKEALESLVDEGRLEVEGGMGKKARYVPKDDIDLDEDDFDTGPEQEAINPSFLKASFEERFSSLSMRGLSRLADKYRNAAVETDLPKEQRARCRKLRKKADKEAKRKAKHLGLGLTRGRYRRVVGVGMPAEKLQEDIESLPFSVSDDGPWIVGGAVVTAKLGLRRSASTLDVAFRYRKRREVAADACREAGWESVACDSGFASEQFVSPDGLTVAFIEHTGPLAEVLERFDLSICQIATDGNHFWAPYDLREDFRHRRFRVMRVTSPERVTKYIDLGLGLHFDRETHQELHGKLWAGKEALPLTSASLTPDEALGLVSPAERPG